MANSTNKKQAAVATASKENKRSPFKDIKELEKEVTSYINLHKTRIQNQAARISDYFEMCCFNYVVRFYERHGYTVSVENLQNGAYRYKCTTQGNQHNFSYFKVSITRRNKTADFEIHHNLAVESGHENGVFTTPDESVIVAESVQLQDGFYEGNKKHSYVENENLVSFCEVKQFTPFPELLFNFIGTLNELKRDLMLSYFEKEPLPQLAPSLMVSGKPSKHVQRIKESLQRRYCINILFDLFDSGIHQFSREQVRCLRKIVPAKRPIHIPVAETISFSEDELPF